MAVPWGVGEGGDCTQRWTILKTQQVNVRGGKPWLFVGASLLAKNSQAPRSFRKHALSLTFFASKLAPTG
ncbi:hypothetical protein EUX53_25010 [Pseudomonas orientalis]|nr:hypothetical protein EUX53_25010 [Pseudomonas orientalis]